MTVEEMQERRDREFRRDWAELDRMYLADQITRREWHEMRRELLELDNRLPARDHI